MNIYDHLNKSIIPLRLCASKISTRNEVKEFLGVERLWSSLHSIARSQQQSSADLLVMIFLVESSSRQYPKPRVCQSTFIEWTDGLFS
jgi:hypothetical protein